MSSQPSAQALLEPNQPIGRRLGVAREKAGLTRAELARRIGVEERSVAAWERDERQPRANRLMTLCGVLGVSLRWFFEGVESEHMADTEAKLPQMSADLARLEALLAEASQLAGVLQDRLTQLKG